MPDILSAGELANLREDLGAMLPDRCVIIRTTEADDAYGGQTRSDAIVGSDIPMTVTTQNNMQLRITAVVTGESLEVVKQAGGEEIRGD
jgi:hypothetical protein